MEILGLVIIVTSLVELILSVKWNVYYFTAGPVLYRKQYRFKNRNISLLKDEKTFRNKTPFGFTPTVIIKKLKTGDYAIRERFFQTTSFSYPAIIRGHIKCNENKQSFELNYRVNWYYLISSIGIPFLFFTSEFGQAGQSAEMFMAIIFTFLILVGFGFGVAAIQHLFFKKPIKNLFPYQ